MNIFEMVKYTTVYNIKLYEKIPFIIYIKDILGNIFISRIDISCYSQSYAYVYTHMFCNKKIDS